MALQWTQVPNSNDSWQAMTAAPSSSPNAGKVYGVEMFFDSHVRTNDTGDFQPHQYYPETLNGCCAAYNGDFYICASNGAVYQQVGGSGAPTQLSQVALWHTMAAAPNGDIYCALSLSSTNIINAGYAGYIFKRAGGVGLFANIGEPLQKYPALTVATNGNVYYGVWNGDIYVQTGGVGSFAATGTGTGWWRHMTADPNGDVYAIQEYGQGMWKQTNGTGSFSRVSIAFDRSGGIAVSSAGKIYLGAYADYVYTLESPPPPDTPSLVSAVPGFRKNTLTWSA